MAKSKLKAKDIQTFEKWLDKKLVKDKADKMRGKFAVDMPTNEALQDFVAFLRANDSPLP